MALMIERDLVRTLCASLNLAQDCRSRDMVIAGLKPDLFLEDPTTKAIIVIENRASVNSLSKLALFARLSNGEKKPTRVVLATKSISEELTSLAGSAGIEVVALPKEYRMDVRPDKLIQRSVKLTTEKSWRIVSRLLKERPSSVRNLSLLENVSYGWAHAVSNNLLGQGITKRQGNLIDVVDPDKLINGISWERPLKRMVFREINIEMDDVFKGAREIGQALTRLNVDFAFAGDLAGSLYTGQAIRFDRLQIYASKEAISALTDVYSEEKGTGATLQVLVPDRDIWKDARIVDGIRIASPAQTLLDLAGMGYASMELTKAMLEVYADL